MTNVQREQGISKLLRDLPEPEIGRTLGQLDMLKGVRVADDGSVHVEIELPTPAYPQRERITGAVEQSLKNAQLLNGGWMWRTRQRCAASTRAARLD
jgi:metal-sulfur cluster biosynthetic enzyme